jgi:glycosyltransferase involved in cell wall biosynthesis
MISNKDRTRTAPLRVAMLVVDANDVKGLTHQDANLESPVLHTAVSNLLSGIQSSKDVEIYVLYGRKNAAPKEARHEGAVRYVPVQYKPVPFLGMGGSLLARTLALLSAIRTLKPDLVHGQGTERESGLVAACCRIPSILTLHGNLSEIARSLQAKPFSYFWIAAKLEQWVLPKVTLIHCISAHTRESVCRRAKKTAIIPNAVAEAFFKVERQPVSHPSVICMAGIAEWKNPLVLVKASDSLHRYDPKTKIHFYGYCASEHRYGRAFLEALESRPWCVHHGHSTQATLLNALASATCSVLPSKQENFGLALAESMAAGVAVLGANVGGIPDVIQNEVTGLLFDPDKPDELAQLLIDLHSDKGKMQRLAEAGRAEAIRRFSIESVSAAHLKMYHELLSKPPTQ